MHAWSPSFIIGFGASAHGVAEKHGKSAAQVIVRLLRQRGIVVLAKTTRRKRIKGNLEVSDFELGTADLSAIAAMDTKTSFFKLLLDISLAITPLPDLST